jgi:hypothetical protein
MGVVDGLVDGMVDRVMVVVVVRIAHRHFAAVVLVAMGARRVFVGEGRRGHGGEQCRAGGGDQ